MELVKSVVMSPWFLFVLWLLSEGIGASPLKANSVAGAVANAAKWVLANLAKLKK